MEDDLVKAALIEDEEDKRLREEAEKDNPEKPEVTPSKEADAPVQPEDEADEEEADPDELDKPEGEEKVEKPEPTSETGDKLTRKERREARQQAWLDSVRREQRQQEQPAPQQFSPQQQPQQPEYKPIDYRTIDEIKEDELEQDRQTYAEIQRRNGMIQGREAERYVAEQQNFWQGVEYEAKILQHDPEYKFLDESNPETFDADLAADLNEKYLEFVGHNPQNNTVRRTDISYEKFVKKEMADRKAYAERLQAESQATLAETKANTGLRPGGSRKSGLGTLKPGDISKMSDEELAKYEDEIDRQILSAYQ